MTKPLSSFPKKQRGEIARRRAKSNLEGLGQLSALDYLALKKEGKLSKDNK